jgi:serine protease Do
VVDFAMNRWRRCHAFLGRGKDDGLGEKKQRGLQDGGAMLVSRAAVMVIGLAEIVGIRGGGVLMISASRKAICKGHGLVVLKGMCQAGEGQQGESKCHDCRFEHGGFTRVLSGKCQAVQIGISCKSEARRESVAHSPMRLPVIFTFAFLVWAGVGFSQDFIDDVEWSEAFEKKLARIAEEGRGLTMGEVKEAVSGKIDGRVSAPKKTATVGDKGPIDIYASVSPAVVAIGSVYQCGECDKWHQDGFSSGWILSPDGLVVTNAHVFEGGKKDVPGVMTRDSEVFPIEEIVAVDAEADIVIFRINTRGGKLPFLPLAEKASVGEEVHVLSHPQGRLWCLTSGRISRFHRQRYVEGKVPTDWMSVTADFAGGSSGGPVVNARGEVVGMVSSTQTAYSEASECKDHPEPDVQMVFKDCVPLKSLRGVIGD